MEPRQRLTDMSLQLQQIATVFGSYRYDIAPTESLYALQRVKIRLHAIRTAFWDATRERNK